jgi:hypothetical protein
MRLAKLAKILLILACVAIYCYSAVSTNSGGVHSISVDTGKPLSIVWPFEISVVGDNGEKGLRIGPNIGRGWRGEAGGQATYRFYVPEDGKFHIWAYCLWFDECANAVFARIDGLDRAIIGNDPLYNQWHWVRGFDVRLKKGTHTLLLSNHSDHVALQRVLFTNSAFSTPDDFSLVFSDIFYDGFDGCDQGNFTNWQAVSGKWGVYNPEQPMRLEENRLARMSEEDALLIYRGDDWSDYLFDIAIKSVVSEGAEGALGVCFGLKDATEYHQLRLSWPERPDLVKMELLRQTAQKARVLAGFEVPWKNDQWHQVEIALDPGSVAVKVDDREPFRAPVDYRITGGIGLSLQGKITAYFDDIHIREATEAPE